LAASAAGTALTQYNQFAWQPPFVLGVGCSGAARALLQLTESLKVPMVSSSATASELSASDWFTRTNPPYMSYAYATADIARHTGLTSVGAVISPLFANGIGAGFAKAVESRNMTAPCGVTVIRSKDTRILAQNLDKMAAVACRAILALADYDLETFLDTEDTALRRPGVSWSMDYADFPKAQLMLAKLQGWLSLTPIVNKKDQMFEQMRRGFDKYWLSQFKQGLRSVNSSTPTIFSATSWNVREPPFLFNWCLLFLTSPLTGNHCCLQRADLHGAPFTALICYGCA